MQYLLTWAELDALTPVKGLQERKEALELARQLIVSNHQCENTHYCSDCPIGQLANDIARDHICIRAKHWPK